ncbi:SLBB domain-containing protein, partial [bacterium]|nr:SLBB domain-containing protein [bacterium]
MNKINRIILILMLILLSVSMLQADFSLISSTEILYNVSLSGAVNNPGVFPVPPSTRVSNVIKLSEIEYLGTNKFKDKIEIPDGELQILKKKYENYYPDNEEK